MSTSNAGDLTPFAKDIEAVFERYFGARAAFALPKDRYEAHWVTNVSRRDGIKILSSTLVRMQAQMN